jgi:outer membrane protein OmpA-like peptidoglycan-associated protein
VKLYLVRSGVAKDRIEAIGYGESRPIADNNTAAGREQNRRIEFRVSGMKS